MFSSPTLSQSFISLILLHIILKKRDGYVVYASLFIIIVLMGTWNTNNEKEEVEYGGGPYQGEEEEEGGDEANNDDKNKNKEFNILMKVCGKAGGRERGRRTKFSFPRCNTNCKHIHVWGSIYMGYFLGMKRSR